MDKVSFQTSLGRNPSNSSYIYIYIYIYFFLLDVNFENLIVLLHILYILNIHVKLYPI